MAVTEGFEPSGKFPRLCLSRTVYLAELYHVTKNGSTEKT